MRLQLTILCFFCTLAMSLEASLTNNITTYEQSMDKTSHRPEAIHTSTQNPDGIDWYQTISVSLVSGLFALVGVTLGQYYLPIRRQKREWFWEKQAEAREVILVNLSEIYFLYLDYNATESKLSFSISNVSDHEVEDKIISLVKKVHHSSALYSRFLNDDEQRSLEEYLHDSQRYLDQAKETHGNWEEGDINAIREHYTRTIEKQG